MRAGSAPRNVTARLSRVSGGKGADCGLRAPVKPDQFHYSLQPARLSQKTRQNAVFWQLLRLHNVARGVEFTDGPWRSRLCTKGEMGYEEIAGSRLPRGNPCRDGGLPELHLVPPGCVVCADAPGVGRGMPAGQRYGSPDAGFIVRRVRSRHGSSPHDDLRPRSHRLIDRVGPP